MNNLNIEDQLHLMQGADMKVSLLSAKCLNINTNSNYNLKDLNKEGTVITVSSEIVLAYEAGFNISLFMDYIFPKTALPVVTIESLVDIINGSDFKLTKSVSAASSLLHLFEVKNLQVMTALKQMNPNIRDLVCRDDFVWITNERKADLLMREYELALALNPFDKNCCFEQTLRNELHESIINSAIKMIVH